MSADESLQARTVILRNLDFRLSADDVRAAVAWFGEVEEVRMITREGRSLGYCFVKFKDNEALERCLAASPLRIGQRDAVVEQAHTRTEVGDGSSGHDMGRSEDESLDPCTARVRNLAFGLSADDVRAAVSQFGEVEEVRLINRGGASLGYCFVKFKDSEALERCLAASPLRIGQRDAVIDQAHTQTEVVDNILVHNIGQRVTVEDLRNHFAPYHVVDAKIVCRYENDTRKGFAFVQVASQADRDAAIRALNQSNLGDRVIFVTAARSAFNASKRNFTRRKPK